MLFKSLEAVHVFVSFSFFLLIHILFRRDVLNEQKVIVKTYVVRKDFHFEQILLFFNFVFIKESKKKVPKNNIKQHSFKTDYKSAY